MAQKRPLTPEKQLLKLIEDPKSKTTAVNAQVIKHQGLSLFSFSAWIGRISFLKDWFKRRLKRPKYHEFDLKIISKALGICIFALAFYFISNLFTSLINFKKMPDLLEMKKEDLKPVSLQEASVSKKAVSYFLEKVRQRDIFKMGQKKPVTAETVTSSSSSRIIEATQHLKLVGISWSNDPDAMIEDTKALRSFFVKRGGLIGEIKVQAIFKDKVVLSYAGEEIELR